MLMGRLFVRQLRDYLQLEGRYFAGMVPEQVQFSTPPPASLGVMVTVPVASEAPRLREVAVTVVPSQASDATYCEV